MIVSHLLLILQKKYSFISLCLKPGMWQKVAKFKGAEYFRKALSQETHFSCLSASSVQGALHGDIAKVRLHSVMHINLHVEHGEIVDS